MKLTFIIHPGSTSERIVTLTQEIIKIGTLPSSHVRIEDKDASRMHSVVEVEPDGRVQVIDLGSFAGTIVNGKKVNKSSLLDGDELRFGGTIVKLRIEV